MVEPESGREDGAQAHNSEGGGSEREDSEELGVQGEIPALDVDSAQGHKGS